MKRKIVPIVATAAMVCAFVALPVRLSTGPVLAAARSAERTPGPVIQPVPGREVEGSQVASVWPMPGAFEWYWHRPDEGLSPSQIDASLSGVKSGMFLSVVNKWQGPLTGVSVNRKRIRIGYRGGSDPREVSIALKLLGWMRLYYASVQPQGQKWLVVVTLASDSAYQISFETEAYARSFIDAVASACKAAGIKLADREGRGFVVSDLTPVQLQALGKGRLESALVTMIAYGGPAEKAGLRFLDLITEVDGVKVRNADHLNSVLDAAAPGATLTLSCLERGEGVEGGAAAPVWIPKAVRFRTAA
jgi:hypothetical protein